MTAQEYSSFTVQELAEEIKEIAYGPTNPREDPSISKRYHSMARQSGDRLADYLAVIRESNDDKVIAFSLSMIRGPAAANETNQGPIADAAAYALQNRDALNYPESAASAIEVLGITYATEYESLLEGFLESDNPKLAAEAQNAIERIKKGPGIDEGTTGLESESDLEVEDEMRNTPSGLLPTGSEVTPSSQTIDSSSSGSGQGGSTMLFLIGGVFLLLISAGAIWFFMQSGKDELT